MRALPLRYCAMGFRFHGMHEIGKFQRILNKEDGRVIADQVKNALISIELGGKATNIAHSVSGTRATLNG